MDECIKVNTGESAENIKKAKNILALSVDKSLFVHISDATTAREIWTKFETMYDDKGLARKIGLLRSLISIRLENTNGMQDYVDQIKTTALKLSGIGFKIDDEWLGAILLAGLTDSYKPLILGIESSGIDITGDKIISKLIDNSVESQENGAFFSQKKQKGKFKKNKKCYRCGEKYTPEHKCTEKKTAKTAFVAISRENESSAMLITNDNEWYIDSGCSKNMTPHKEILNDYKNAADNGNIITAGKECLKPGGIGNVRTKVNGNEIDINNVLHVPGLSANLLSVSKIVKTGNKVIFDDDGCTVYNKITGKKVLHCNETNGVYKMKTSNTNNAFMSATNKNNTAIMWHRKLGHLNFQTLTKMKNAVHGVKFTDDDTDIRNCVVCAEAKQSRQPFKKSESKTNHVLELIHSDLMGPMETKSIGGARYILTFVDDFTKKVFAYFLKSKGDVLDKFIEFKVLIEKQSERKIKVFRTDNGTEYVNNEFEKFCKTNGIIHQMTNVYTPQQNGVAERVNRTIVEKAKCLLFDAGLSKCYWAEAVNMAVYIINRTVSSAHGKIPEEVHFGKKVDLSNLKLFGSYAMTLIPKQKRKKWDKNSEKLIFVGFDSCVKGYRLINPKNRKLTISRDVKFLDGRELDTIEISSDDESENMERESDHETHDESEDEEQVEVTEANENSASGSINQSAQESQNNSTKNSESEGELDYTNGDVSSTGEQHSEYLPDESIGSVPNSNITLRKKNNNGSFNLFHSKLVILTDEDYVFKCDSDFALNDPIEVNELKGRSDEKNVA